MLAEIFKFSYFEVKGRQWGGRVGGRVDGLGSDNHDTLWSTLQAETFQIFS